MTNDDETPEIDDERPEIDDDWQFGDWASTAATDDGPGLLQKVLDEVMAMRIGAKADRIALASAISGSFAKIELQMAELRDEIASVRAELEASRDAASTAQVARVALEVRRLRNSLIGPG